MERRITKAKVHKGRVHLKYVRRKGTMDADPDEYTLNCRDAPHPDLEKALADLVPHLVEWLELPADTKLAGRLTPISVAYTWRLDTEDQEDMGASVCALLSLSPDLEKALMSRSPLVLNCPHKPSRPYNAKAEDEEYDYCLPPETVAALGVVLMEAEAYVDGKRAQGSLDLEPRTGAAEPAEPAGASA